MNPKIKAAIAILLVINVVYLVSIRTRRANAPKLTDPLTPREWNLTLSERTPEDREQVLSAAFALSDFEIKPLNEEGDILIPRPMKWFEEIVITTHYQSAPSGGHETSEKNNSRLPWRGGPVNVAMKSLSLVAYESEPGPKAEQVVVKEKLVGIDNFISKNGIEVPATELFAVGRYFLDDKKYVLLATQKAVQINGQAVPRYQADVPHWLVPQKKFVVGETWVQHGALPEGIPSTSPVPEALRKLNRLVLFEGRRAAEIESSSTFYDFIPGPVTSHAKRKERTVCYLDLESGEPLWFESKSESEKESGAVVRGCNQIFVKHLIRAKPKD